MERDACCRSADEEVPRCRSLETPTAAVYRWRCYTCSPTATYPSSAFRARAGSRRSNSNTIRADRSSWPSCAGCGSSTVPRFSKPPGGACPGSSECSRRPMPITRTTPLPTTMREEGDEAPPVEPEDVAAHMVKLAGEMEEAPAQARAIRAREAAIRERSLTDSAASWKRFQHGCDLPREGPYSVAGWPQRGFHAC